MKLRLIALVLMSSWLLVAGSAAPAAAAATTRLVVSPTGPFTTIQAALDTAVSGDTIEVHSGVYDGPLVVDKSVQIEGVDWPVIDGRNQGTVVTLTAPDITFRGFVVTGSGIEPDRDHAGITLEAPRIVVENNRLENVLFGIFVAQADDSIVRGNEITSKPEYDHGRKGDGIRLWYSQRVLVADNHVYNSRDLVLWYSSDVILRHNVVEDGRYGVHLMYCDGALIEDNQFLNNSVGIYTMYSNHVTVQRNLLRGHRGPSGYGLGFKDADHIQVLNNVLVNNGAGIFLDGTPFNPPIAGGEPSSLFKENIIAYNDVGVILQPAVRGNVFTGNTFWENAEQVSIQGGGVVGSNEWQGNTWSDYAGFDGDGDGLGDVPYQSERFFEGMTDREPRLRAVLYSPAAQAIEFTARTFPVIRPQPKLTDPAPRLEPAPLPDFAVAPANQPWGMLLTAVALLSLGILCGALAFYNPPQRNLS